MTEKKTSGKILLKFKDSYSIHITSCWSVFTDIGIRSTIKFRNGKFNKNKVFGQIQFSPKFINFE